MTVLNANQIWSNIAINPAVWLAKAKHRHAVVIPAMLGLSGAAHRHAVDAQGRLADAHRHALPFLAAHPDAGIEPHVVAYHRHAVQHLRTIADQRGAFYRIGDLAVLDHVRLARGEHELAVGDVDLAAAEVHRI